MARFLQNQARYLPSVLGEGKPTSKDGGEHLGLGEIRFSLTQIFKPLRIMVCLIVFVCVCCVILLWLCLNESIWKTKNESKRLMISKNLLSSKGDILSVFRGPVYINGPKVTPFTAAWFDMKN